MRILLPFIAIFLLSCSDQKPQPQPVPKAAAPKPADESRRFPKANLVDTKVIDDHLMDKSFMPGGTLATYKKGKSQYQMFVAKFPSATDSAIVLPDWQKALLNAKLAPAFGGYFGKDGATPVFVFVKGAWIAGISGLSETEADTQARILAAQLN